MATVTNSKIRSHGLRIKGISHPSRDSHAGVPFDSHALELHLQQYQPAFYKIVGENPTQSLLFSTAETSRNRFFHGGCVYVEGRDEIYATSGLLPSSNSSTLPSVVISRVSVKLRGTDPDEGQTATTARPHVMSAEWAKLRPPSNMPLPAGACAQGDGILFCSQGNLTADTGGLFYMPSGRPPVSVVTRCFRRPFNSPQNITCDRDSGVWFTDSNAGHLSGIRSKPQVRNHVYRYDAESDDLRVVADDMGRPTGIALSPDQETMYITDTEAQQPDGTIDASLSATIYAYDVVRRSGGVFLASKRVFAYAADGVPSAVACDPAGNVYAACGDGVEIWSAGGAALGLLAVPGGCSGMCFGRNGELFVCAGHSLWRVQFDAASEPVGESSSYRA